MAKTPSAVADISVTKLSTPRIFLVRMLVFLILCGLVQVEQASLAGKILSLVLALGGIFAFSIHTYFNSRGHPEFKTPISIPLLAATLCVSVAQLVTTILWLR